MRSFYRVRDESQLCIDKHIFFLSLSFSSLDFEECAHKLLKMDFPESQTVSLNKVFFWVFLLFYSLKGIKKTSY